MGVKVYVLVRRRARNHDYRWIPAEPADDLRDLVRGLTSFEERSLVLHSSGPRCRLLVTGLATGAVDEVGTATHAAVQLEAEGTSETKSLATVVRLWLDAQDDLLLRHLVQPAQRGDIPDLASLPGRRDEGGPLNRGERRLDELRSPEGRLGFLGTVDALCTGTAGMAAVLSLVGAPSELAQLPADVLHVLGQDVEAGVIPDPKAETRAVLEPSTPSRDQSWLAMAATALGLALLVYLLTRRV